MSRPLFVKSLSLDHNGCIGTVRNESADYRFENDRLQRELEVNAEKCKRVEWKSFPELGREIQSTKERLVEQHRKKENSKEHLRVMIKEKEEC